MSFGMPDQETRESKRSRRLGDLLKTLVVYGAISLTIGGPISFFAHEHHKERKSMREYDEEVEKGKNDRKRKPEELNAESRDKLRRLKLVYGRYLEEELFKYDKGVPRSEDGSVPGVKFMFEKKCQFRSGVGSADAIKDASKLGSGRNSVYKFPRRA